MSQVAEYDVAIIGGGAAGFFTALQLKERKSLAKVVILEKTSKLLQKVKISGGGRCNVTHHTDSVEWLLNQYPRGMRELRAQFEQFSPMHTVQWFAERGIKLHTEADGRMFPYSNDSQTIISCFLEEAYKHQVEIRTQAAVVELKPNVSDGKASSWNIALKEGDEMNAQIVVMATGGLGSADASGLLTPLGIEIETPLPSLFTFNVPFSPFKSLAGISVPSATVSFPELKLKAVQGPLLITHWGFSGPSVLRLSAFGAKELAAVNYRTRVRISWVGESNLEIVKHFLQQELSKQPLKQLQNWNPYFLPSRLWEALLQYQDIEPTLRLADVSKQSIHKIAEALCFTLVEMNGKTTFKEEFVTAGGVKLKQLRGNSLESKQYEGLYFAGELLNVDGVTGGFNFQHAWASAVVVAKGIAAKLF